MANATLDRLLTTLADRIHAVALCEINTGWRLAFGPMEAVTNHSILSGTGSLRTTGGIDTSYAPFRIIVVLSNVSQIPGEAGGGASDVSAAESCGLVADRLVRFTAGDGSRDTLIVCAMISACYGGALGLFDNLRCPVAADVSRSDSMRGLFAAMLEEVGHISLKFSFIRDDNPRLNKAVGGSTMGAIAWNRCTRTKDGRAGPSWAHCSIET